MAPPVANANSVASSGPTAEDAPSPPLAVQAKALRDALCWIVDMVTGQWTTPENLCPMCVEGKCSTLCAQSRINYAMHVLEENPL